MSETEQLMRFPVPEAATSLGVADPSTRLARPVRLWVVAVCGLTLLNVALALWYVVYTGDFSTFFSHQLLTPFLAILHACSACAARRPRNPIGWFFIVARPMFSAPGRPARTYTRPFPRPLCALCFGDLQLAWAGADPAVRFVSALPDGHLPRPAGGRSAGPPGWGQPS
jgi:hypothetical protein